eukprot:TRINITY_DN1634_c0_g1_i1.p1 TRINITY_DN1634_c0_g1~~TRINITY_DN1634_c0_g1_i1.p1  ORF type:complete len:124 (+),score=24.44 TRINITY_DN1634_c0_g1_i1:51-422(+)
MGGGVKRQLAAPDRPKKKAKSVDSPVSPTLVTEVSTSATDMVRKETTDTKPPTSSKNDLMSPASSQPEQGSAKKKKKKKSKFSIDDSGLGVRTVKKGTGVEVSEGSYGSDSLHWATSREEVYF